MDVAPHRLCNISVSKFHILPLSPRLRGSVTKRPVRGEVASPDAWHVSNTHWKIGWSLSDYTSIVVKVELITYWTVFDIWVGTDAASRKWLCSRYKWLSGPWRKILCVCNVLAPCAMTVNNLHGISVLSDVLF